MFSVSQTYGSLQDVLVSFGRRVLCYPLYRHFSMVSAAVLDTTKILQSGESPKSTAPPTHTHCEDSLTVSMLLWYIVGQKHPAGQTQSLEKAVHEHSAACNVPPAKRESGPTPTPYGSEMWISREWTVDFDILKPRVIFKSKAPADR